MAAAPTGKSFYVRLLQRLGHHRWFAVLVKHVVSKIDRALYRASGGRFSASGRELPTMLLTTRGRKTGKERTVPVYYVRDGENLVSACESFGLEARSSWPRNLLADPWATIQVGRSVREYRGRPATEEEAGRAMPGLLDIWPAHDTYLQRSGERYVFVFEPVEAEPEE